MRLSLPLLTATLLLFILLTCNVGHTASLNVNRKHIIKHIQPERSVLRVVASKQLEAMSKRGISMKKHHQPEPSTYSKSNIPGRHNPALPRPPSQPVVV